MGSSPNVGTGKRWTQQCRARKRLQGGINSVSDRSGVQTTGVDAYGKNVWARRLDAGVKSCGRAENRTGLMCPFRKATEAREPVHRGERAISRKAIAQGMSDVLRCPVCSCAAFLCTFAHETAGAARIRHSLRPLILEGEDSGKPRAHGAARLRVFCNDFGILILLPRLGC